MELIDQFNCNTQPCDLCRGSKYTERPFTVITQTRKKVETVFNYCPVCGRDLRKEEDVDRLTKELGLYTTMEY